MSAMERICALDALTPEEITTIPLRDGRPSVAATVWGGRAYVFPDRCPHASESLSKGFVEDGRIICGVHFAEFDLQSGSAHNAPSGCGRLFFFTTELRDGEVWADLSPLGAVQSGV
jgi:3-phenylpropionate/trans-cinnamate dioxygenase ferredoxin subunit